MTRLAVKKDAIPLDTLRAMFDDPVRIKDPATWVDDNGDEWWLFRDHRFVPSMAGRLSAAGQGTDYSEPTYPDDPGPDFDPFEFEIGEQGQEGRRPVTVQVNAEGLRPKPTDEEGG